MKKIITIVSVGLLFLALLLLASVWIVSIFFKDDIRHAVDNIIESHVNATVHYDINNVSISIISTFPNIEFAMKNMCIVNREPFAGDTLMHIYKFAIELEVMELLSSHVVVAGIRVEDPVINITSKNKDSTVTDGNVLPSITLKHWKINNAMINYEDQQTKTYVKLKGLSQQGNAKLKNGLLQTKVTSSIASIDASYNKMKYLTRHRLSSTINASYDLKTATCTLQKTSIQLNDFSVHSTGDVQILEDSNGYKVNLSLTTKSDFKSLLSVIPAIYHNKFDEVKASGTILFNAMVKGIYSDSLIPSFAAKLKVQHGRFQYASLPMPVEQIEADIAVSNTNNKVDNTDIHIRQLQFSINKHIIKAEGTVQKLDNYQLSAKGEIDFEELEKVYPLEATRLAGIISFNLQSKGSIKKIQKEQYGGIKTYGMADITNMQIVHEDIPTTTINKMQLRIKPSSIVMPVANMQIGKSDMLLEGSFFNYVGYLFKRQQVLKGKFSVKSRLIDLNEWMTSDEQYKAKTKVLESLEEEQKKGAVTMPTKLPTNIAFQLNADIKNIEMLDIPMSKLRGNISLKDGAINFNNVAFVMLEGHFTSSGSYQTKGRSFPISSIELKGNNVSVKEAYAVCNTVKRWAPIAKYIEGKADVLFAFTSTIGKDYYPIYSSMNGKGKLHIPQAGIQGFELFDQLALITGVKELKDPSLVNTDIEFTIKDGKLYTPPFHCSVEGIDAKIHGTSSLSGEVDYQLDANIPGKMAQPYLKQTLGSGAASYANMIDKIPISVYFTGKYDKVKISLAPNKQKVGALIKQQVAKMAKEEKVKKVVNKQAQKIIGDLMNKNDKRSDLEKINSALEQGKKHLIDLFKKKKE